MRYRRYFLLVCSVILTFLNLAYSAGEKGDISLGLRMGLNYYDGDVKNSALTPCIYGNLGYNINDFFSLGIEGGYSALEDKDRSNFKIDLNWKIAAVVMTFVYMIVDKIWV